MSELIGVTRTVVKLRYALFTPDSFVPSNLPGWKNAACVVNISPALGARFTQMHITLSREGTGEGNTGRYQHFFYVIEGTGTIGLQDKRHRLEPGSYIYLPPGKDMQIKNSGPEMRVLIFQKLYEAQKGAPAPSTVIGHAREIKAQPISGNEATRLQALLPDQMAFDMAVDIFTFQPGATQPTVQAHVMERGLLMLSGQGTCRLETDSHSVQAGDVIWTAPYCPQWFKAIDKDAASYICYKDVNRDPM